MESLRGVYLDTLGHYLINPLIFSSFSFFLSIELKEPNFLELGFVAFLIHQYSRLAKDISHSVRYVQIDPDANPRQNIKNGICDSKSVINLGRAFSMLRIPAAYVFDAINMSLIVGVLRTFVDLQLYNISIEIYMLLIISALLGTSMIILLHFYRLS